MNGNDEMTPPGPKLGRGWVWAALAAITAVALALRVYKLGDWPLADDEIYRITSALREQVAPYAEPEV